MSQQHIRMIPCIPISIIVPIDNLSPVQSTRRKQKKFNHRTGRMSIANRVEKKPLNSHLHRKISTALYNPSLMMRAWSGSSSARAMNLDGLMSHLSQSCKEGTLEVEGTKDVLTLALGTPERNGRVRGVGDGVTSTQYFRLIKCGSKKHVHAKGTSHSPLPNPILPLGKDLSCTLAVGSKSNIIAKGTEKIGQPSKSKGEKTKSAGHNKGNDLYTSFGAMIGTIIQSGRLKFPYGQELFGTNIEFSYIETNDVKDVCNLESVESPYMVAYMR
ncbi:hypothetical protein IFM89_012749 [Coptis chinensis]|uniref:Uncharacterized protein n=1 Tax=Coptis chinensis TaxID=261450 RepID=A0A835HB34_9MAGN|nr:hypothetical protein IFM89_012749 [Coptis chinensis]